jgi:hypothetical protein
MMNTICFCLAGWHYNHSFYTQISEIPDSDVFVISHKNRSQIPEKIKRIIQSDHIFSEMNFGYDWGCYQQFIQKKIWKKYDYIFFLHDDMLIKNSNFVPHVIDLINDGAAVVGNGINSNKRNWPQTHLFCYAHSIWLPPSLSFKHDTVRGSFIGMATQALKILENFEVCWDKNHSSIRFGNHSLIATSGKIQHLFGGNAFSFLGKEYLTSPYILELERGGLGRKTTKLSQKLYIILYNRIGKLYVRFRMTQKGKYQKIK